VFVSVLQVVKENNRITGGKARTSDLVMWRRSRSKGYEEVNVPSWCCKNAGNGVQEAAERKVEQEQLVIVR
jgi:hypothetical protein